MLVNGNEYKIPDVDYDIMCKLAEYGANLFSDKEVPPQLLIRAFLALKTGSTKKASAEIQAHIAKYGFEDMATWAVEIRDAIEEGGFFSAAREAAKAAERKAKRAAAKQAKAEEAVEEVTED